MDQLYTDIRTEIEELHVFFVDWFKGNAVYEELDEKCLSHLDDQLTYIHPSGIVLSKDELAQGFRSTYGSNKEFRIKIRDVDIRHVMPEQVLVTYTEWQTGSSASENGNNIRFTTALMTTRKPFRWLHLHETSLPEAAHKKGRTAGAFDF